MDMTKKLVNYILENVDSDEIGFTYSKMCIEKTDLARQNWELYNKLENYVDDFISDNELDEDWFETEIGLIDDLFEELLKEI